jgi:hypothetical protein
VENLVAELNGIIDNETIHGDKPDERNEEILAVIEHLISENQKLREALKPFAELGIAMLPEEEDDNSSWATTPDNTKVNNVSLYNFTFGKFRKAARAYFGEE